MWFSCVFSGLRTESEYNTSISILFCCVFRLFLLTNSNSCLLKYVYPNDKLHLPCFVFFFFNLSQLALPTDFYECNRKEYGKIGLKESGKATGRESNVFLERYSRLLGQNLEFWLVSVLVSLYCPWKGPWSKTHIVKKNSDHLEFWMQLWPTLLLSK